MHLSMGAGKVNAAASGMESGAGVRLFKNDLTAYAYTNDLSEAGLMKAAAKAAAAISDSSLIKTLIWLIILLKIFIKLSNIYSENLAES